MRSSGGPVAACVCVGGWGQLKLTSRTVGELGRKGIWWRGGHEASQGAQSYAGKQQRRTTVGQRRAVRSRGRGRHCWSVCAGRISAVRLEAVGGPRRKEDHVRLPLVLLLLGLMLMRLHIYCIWHAAARGVTPNMASSKRRREVQESLLPLLQKGFLVLLLQCGALVLLLLEGALRGLQQSGPLMMLVPNGPRMVRLHSKPLLVLLRDGLRLLLSPGCLLLLLVQ